MRLCGGQLCLYLSNCQFSYLLAGPISASNFTLREVFFRCTSYFEDFIAETSFTLILTTTYVHTHTMYLFTLMMCIVVFRFQCDWLPSTTHPHFTFFIENRIRGIEYVPNRFWFLFFGLYPLIGIASVGVLQISDKNWADHFWNIMNTLNFTRRRTCWCKISPCNQR